MGVPFPKPETDANTPFFYLHGHNKIWYNSISSNSRAHTYLIKFTQLHGSNRLQITLP